ncbi:imelysin family protein [Oceanobacter sp. 5_MG-2023]|jgi:predicted lipoprotein|uniref:imelysin family protein n=2 Tax=Gammaproteobacteria TaxID=1236 RepID=UPI0026E2D0FA|nr:imelysin family protein [Oceanobacter sp. 5_MG-2023]MDO6681894.1 imelysin family protein [Oceanobacter sp. 5_MG-2023]
MLKSASAWLCLGTCLTLASCGGSRENDAVALTEGSLSLALEQLVDGTIIVASEQFASEVSDFNNSVDSFCSAPDEAGLSQLQTDWKTMADSWYRLLPFNFGPLFDDTVFPVYQFVDSYRVRGTNYTATVRSNIQTLIDSESETELGSSYFDGLTFQYVGLLPLEVVAFETASDQSQVAADIVAEFIQQPRKCEVMEGLAGSVQNRADYVVNGWTLDHLESGTSYRDLFLAGDLDDGSEPLTALISAVQSYLDYLQQRDTVSNVAALSGNAWPEMQASIDVITELLEGSESTTVSLFDLMESAGNSADADTVRSNLEQANDAISDQDATSFNSMAAALDGNFKREIPDGLDVSLGINFSDGD